jgi:rhamnose transport system permease protein
MSEKSNPVSNTPQWAWLRSWNTLLLAILLLVILNNIRLTPDYLGTDNFVNMFQLFIEKLIVVLAMTFIIINGEIDLSVASVMGLTACLMAKLFESGVPMELAVIISLACGAILGAFNGFWVAFVGLPSLAVTLATSLFYKGLAEVLLEDGSIGDFPTWFTAIGQDRLFGIVPPSIVIFIVLFAIAFVILQYTAFGRYVYIIGNNKEVARFSGIDVRRVKMTLYIASGVIAALAGILYASRLGAVRASTANGFELDIITMVLLGGVSIFGGTGTLVGVGLSMLVTLNIRNGMGLVNASGNFQTMVIGVLLILSVLIPNVAQTLQDLWKRRQLRQVQLSG